MTLRNKISLLILPLRINSAAKEKSRMFIALLLALTGLFISFASKAQWTAATLSQARTQLSAASSGSKVFFAGGFKNITTCSDVVDIYDNIANAWTIANLPQARCNLVGASIGTKVFFAGGEASGVANNNVDIYDTSTASWTTATLSQARGQLSATSVGSKIFFGGGYNGSIASNVVDIYDNNSNTWTTASLSQARYYLSSTSVGTKVFFAGGVTSASVASNVVDIYDNSSNTWSTATLSQARWYLTATSVGTKVFFAGGQTGAYSNIVDIYDNSNNTWSTATLSQAREGLSSTSVENKVFFAGGTNGSNSNVIDIYDNSANNWTTATLSEARGYLSAASVGTKALFGGGSDASGNTISNVVDIYTLPPTITNFSPNSGSIGTTVTITGTNFSTTQSNNIVYFGATKATVTDATATQLTVTVPAGATYQPITVTTNGLTAYSSKPFIVTFPSSGIINASSFATKVDFTTAEAESYFVGIGDLDGDGKSDMAVSNYTGSSVSVLRNTSSSGTITGSSFATKVDFTPGTRPSGMALGDLDGDGKLDMVVTNYTSSSVSIFQNTSTTGSITSGSFGSRVDLATTTRASGAMIGDLDGDGKPDLVVANNDGTTVSVFQNIYTTGAITTSSFAPKIDFTVGTNPLNINIADLDADGKPELVVANGNSNNISILKNTSTLGSISAGSFASAVNLTTGSGPTNRVGIGDLDGDGKPDLAVVLLQGAKVSIFRNISAVGIITTGSFAANIDFTTGTRPLGVTLGDLDGDGKLEIAVVCESTNTVSVYKNTSTLGVINTSSFAAKIDFPKTQFSYDVNIADIDGDGKPDLVVGNGNNSISVFRNTTIISEPTAQATSLTFISIQPTSMTLSWSAATGSPTGYLVLRKTISSPTEVPVDGTGYSTGNAISTSTVAYAGGALTFNEAGLTASTTYFYDVFAYNGTTGAYNYLTTSPLEGSKTTLATEPTAQPASLIFSSVQSTTMTLSWTAASSSPAGYLVLRNTVSSLTDVPVDATAYTTGNTIGTSTVAFAGSALTFNETSLAPLTNYFYNVFAYNGTTGTYNYLTISPLAGNQTTLAAEPTAQPTSLIFTNVQSTTMTLNWTAASGSPVGYIVLRNTVSSLTDIPVDGAAYSAGNTIGTSTVAYAGSALTFNETSLTPLTNYFYKVFSYNGTTSTYNYLTLAPLVGTQTTLAAPPTAQPTALSFSNVQTTSITLTWIAATGSPTGYLVLRKTVSSPTDVPVDGIEYSATNLIGTSTVAYAASGITFIETGLIPSTNYFYDVFSYNGTTGTYNYLTTSPLENNQTTSPTLAPEPTAQPTSLLFSSVQPTSMTLAWTAATGSRAGYVVIRKTVSSPTDVPLDGTEYSATNTIGTSTVAYVGSALTFNETGLTASTTYFYDIFSYNGITGTYNYLTTSPLENNQTTSPALASEPTAQPTSLLFSTVQATSMTLSWTAALGSPAGYIVLRKTVSSPTDVPLDGTEYTTGNAIGASTVAYAGSSLTFNETSLSAATTYYYDVFSFNGSGATINYLTALPLEGSKSTLATEPASQPTALVFSNVGSTTFTVSFTAATGTPSGYIVVRKAGSVATSLPVDATGYSSASAIGDGTIAYVGTAVTFNETGLTAGTNYFYQVYAYNGSGVTINYRTASPLTGNKSIDSTKPVIVHSPIAIVDKDVSLAITAQITDPESGVASASLFYKNRLTTSTEVILEMTLTGNNWAATIPASAIGEIGVEYWITALNGLGLAEQTPHYPVAVKQPSDGPPLPYDNFGSGQSNYRIISFPYQLDNKNAGNVFEELGQFDQFNWRLSHWNGTSTKELIATDPIETGWGYWLLVKNNPGKALTGGPGKSVSSPFSIQLKQGWNQIGNPYNFNIDWSDIQNANSFIGTRPLKIFTGAPYDNSTILKKMEGGFVFAEQASILIFPPSKSKSGRLSESKTAPSNPFEADSWELALNVKQGELANSISGIGMQSDAKIGFDKYDDVSLPRFIEYIDLNHENVIHGNPFSKDVVPTSENHSWTFTIESNDKKEFASISWANSSFTENEKELFLIDENEKISINMRTLNSYSFKTPSKFKIIFGKTEYIAKEMPDGQGKILSVSPNPTHGETKITVSLPGWGNDYPVSIDLINSLGQKVTDVYSGNLVSGSHELQWGGFTATGDRPATGIYFLRLIYSDRRSFYRIVLD